MSMVPLVEPVDERGLSITAPVRVPRAVMVHRWDRLSFVHWPCAPERIQRLLPPGLEVDTFDGTGWIGLIPFRLSVRPWGLPALPWIGRCSEANVRTYVRGVDGGRGIWFFSLEAARLPLVLAARAWYHLPYKWARMRTDVGGSSRRVRYRSTRRWPSRGQSVSVELALGPRLDLRNASPLERFLVCRWRLYSATPEGLAVTEVDHPPWPLRRATLLSVEQSLFAAAGLPEPQGEPLVHHSSGVDVRFARRRLLLPA
jgi:uncharacterized protein YqjF (DUF2071 family)